MNAIRIAAAAVVAVLALTSCKKVLNKGGDDSFHTRISPPTFHPSES